MRVELRHPPKFPPNVAEHLCAEPPSNMCRFVFDTEKGPWIIEFVFTDNTSGRVGQAARHMEMTIYAHELGLVPQLIKSDDWDRTARALSDDVPLLPYGPRKNLGPFSRTEAELLAAIIRQADHLKDAKP
jgi:hypothetical protein